jgi:hypothetical protein
MYIQVHEVFRTLNGHDQKRTFPCHIIVKMPRVQNKENNENSKMEMVSYLQKQICQHNNRPNCRNTKSQKNTEQCL